MFKFSSKRDYDIITRPLHRYRVRHGRWTLSVPSEHSCVIPGVVRHRYIPNHAHQNVGKAESPKPHPRPMSSRPAVRKPALRSASFHLLSCAPPRLLISVCTVVILGSRRPYPQILETARPEQRSHRRESDRLLSDP